MPDFKYPNLMSSCSIIRTKIWMVKGVLFLQEPRINVDKVNMMANCKGLNIPHTLVSAIPSGFLDMSLIYFLL